MELRPVFRIRAVLGHHPAVLWGEGGAQERSRGELTTAGGFQRRHNGHTGASPLSPKTAGVTADHPLIKRGRRAVPWISTDALSPSSVIRLHW